MRSEQDFVSLFQIAAVTYMYLYNTKTYNHVNIT